MVELVTKDGTDSPNPIGPVQENLAQSGGNLEATKDQKCCHDRKEERMEAGPSLQGLQRNNTQTYHNN